MRPRARHQKYLRFETCDSTMKLKWEEICEIKHAEVLQNFRAPSRGLKVVYLCIFISTIFLKLAQCLCRCVCQSVPLSMPMYMSTSMPLSMPINVYVNVHANVYAIFYANVYANQCLCQCLGYCLCQCLCRYSPYLQ